MLSCQKIGLTLCLAIGFFGGFTKISASECCSLYCCEDPPVCWEGFYLSAQLGAGSKHEHVRFANPNYFNTLGPLLVGSSFSLKSQGFVGGGALGYNYQNDNFVVRLEAGAMGLNLKKTRSSPLFPITDRFTTKLPCLYNAKIRVGYAYKRILGFITGGWVGGNLSLTVRDTFAEIVARSKKWTNGWTVGAGADYKIARNLSLGLAYDYSQMRYKHRSTSCPLCGEGVGLGTPRLNNHIHMQTLTVRLNLHF